jgi:DNA-binding XRE family transcriptional regulator
MKDRIRRIRGDLNMNQTEFGSELGASRAMIASYEVGKVVPDKSIRLLICQKFNVNESWLETGEGVPYKEGLIPSLAQALQYMPDVAATLERILPRLTPQDLANFNEMVKHAFPDK